MIFAGFFAILPSRRGTKPQETMSNLLESENRIIADEDRELVRLCQKGDLTAFEALVKKHQKKMLNTAYRLIGSYEEACEAVQDAFVSAFKAIKKFRGDSQFSTWLYRIVINHAKNRRRQVLKLNHREGFAPSVAASREDLLSQNDPPADGPSPLEHMEKREVEGKVRECIDRLEDGYREVVVLRDIQGFSYEEISDMLKVPEGTIKSRLSRGRENLKNCLKQAFGAW
jgi:RNA polymerase sigma-70 factor (ECF subfamily)